MIIGSISLTFHLTLRLPQLPNIKLCDSTVRFKSCNISEKKIIITGLPFVVAEIF